MTVIFIEVKSCHIRSDVGGRVVMVQGTGIIAPPDWTFVPDIFPQLPQNIATEVSIHGL
jgi:hypothetical protein